jgi:hypothetical protein
MATIIKIKRSSGTSTPNLGQGEIGYSWGTGTYTDAQSATVTSYGKMYLGTGTESGGIAANIEVIGGKYFTDMLDHGHGTLTANSAVLVDSAKKIDLWNVDNLRLDGNTISSTDADGDINLDPNGNGEIVVPDDTYLTFGTSKDTKIKYDEATDDRLEVTGADWNFANGVAISLSDTTQSTTTSTGALVVTGGVGIGGNLNVGGSVSVGSLATPSDFTVSGDLTVQGGDINITQVATNFNIKDNTSGALVVKEGTNEYINVTTTDNSESVTVGNALASLNLTVEDNAAAAFKVAQGANNYIQIATTDDSELVTFGNSLTSIDNVVEDNKAAAYTVKENTNVYIKVDTTDNAEAVTVGNNLASVGVVVEDNAAAAFTVKEGSTEYVKVVTTDNAEKVVIGNTIASVDIAVEDNKADAFTIKEGANEYVVIDTNNGSELLTISTANVDIDNDLNIDGGDLTTNQATFNLLNTNATTVNAFGAATTIEIGAATGTTNINNNLDVDGDVNIDGGDLTVSTATFNLANANATTVNAFGAATTIEIGAATGTTNINNNLDVDGDVNIDGGDLTVSTSTFNLANTNATTVNFAGAATTVEIGAATGTTNINNNLDVDGDVNIDGGDLTVSTTTFNLANTNATTVNFAGAATTLNIGSASTEVDFGDLRIVGSTIYSDNASAQTITIDPYPAGGDAAGNVVVRGNLQVSGTTTTVNSTQMTINDPIFTLGDSISEKTVISAAASGQANISLDDVEGLNVGDIVSGNAAIPNGTTISAINTGTKVITLSANLTTGIAASTNTSPKILTFTQGADDNRDRGIEFKYFNGSLKTGFFGYDESGISEDTTNYYFTYIPDATNTNNVFTGTVGSAYFKTVKLDDGVLNGVAFFDQYKRLTRTVAAGTSDATTSNQILTVNGSGVPVWTTTLDGGTY